MTGTRTGQTGRSVPRNLRPWWTRRKREVAGRRVQEEKEQNKEAVQRSNDDRTSKQTRETTQLEMEERQSRESSG